MPNNGYDADPVFQKYYEQILAGMNPNTIEYTAPTADEIAAQISEYLRPAVDQQIRSRQEATAQQRAATDADAAARGILSSTWVTDIKNRLKQSENADIAAAESNYRSQLLEGVFNRQAQEADRANQIAIFNAQMRAQAEKDAYQRAGDMYNLYLKKKASGGGGGGSGAGAAQSTDPNAAAAFDEEGYIQSLWNRYYAKLGARGGSRLDSAPLYGTRTVNMLK